ncbi:MAG: DEAD/DEAH box helicase, partial [Myxococcota bacterium]
NTGIQTTAVYGGAPMGKQIAAIEAGAEVISGTPGRVLDHLRRGTLDPSTLRVLVLDEADEILSMGFAKELNAILELLPETRQTLLFSATVDNDVQRVADRHMKDPEFVSLSSDQVGATTISHYAYFVPGTGRGSDLVRILEIEDPESAVIFCNTKVETERVASQLQVEGFNADWLNGDLPQSEREKVMARTREGALRYLVATDVAARGIDISHLSHVINYTFPAAVEQYIHRTGRTGRAGRTGTAISLVSPQELGALYYLRLQYKIFPVERTLPSASEARTRVEADRIVLLQAAFGGQPGELDLAVARRLLTHPSAERILAGLLQSFFGAQGEDVDDQAATMRRARRPEPVKPPAKAEARRSRPKRTEPKRKASNGTGAPSPARGDQRADDSTDDSTDDSANRRPDERADHRADGGVDEETVDTDTFARVPEATPPEATAGDSRTEGSEDDGMTRLYLNVGRRDGARAGELARFIRSTASIERGDIGRIRVRDKHTFIQVRSELVDQVVDSLNGKIFEDREVRLEPAKSGA